MSRPTREPIEAVLLDVGGVLMLPGPRRIERALGDLGFTVDPETARRAHFVGMRALDEPPPQPSPYWPYLPPFARALGIPPDQFDAAVERLARQFSRPSTTTWTRRVPGAGRGVRRLSETGLKLGIVSNADGTIERQLRHTGICQVGAGRGIPVLAIVDSGILGISKPDPGIFRHALELLGGVAPERAVYVGDSLRYDVRGAQAAGLRPVHMDPFDLCGAPEDHPHVRSLLDVLPIVTEGD